LLLVALVVPPVVALTRFGFLVSEPRYALPLYGVVPLLAGALWRIRLRLAWPNVGRSSVVGVVLAFNLWSLLSTDLRLGPRPSACLWKIWRDLAAERRSPTWRSIACTPTCSPWQASARRV